MYSGKIAAADIAEKMLRFSIFFCGCNHYKSFHEFRLQR